MPHGLTKRAQRDVDDTAYLITRENSDDVAARLIGRLNKAFRMLSDHPYAGRSRHEDLGQSRRSIAVAGYVVVYRVIGSDAVILRVVDGRRNYPPIIRS